MAKYKKPRQEETSRGRQFLALLVLFILIGIGGVVYYKFKSDQMKATKQANIAALLEENRKIIDQQRRIAEAQPKPKVQLIRSSNGKYMCDGRRYCSQMRSLEEARWYLRYCPNTKMDGDNDGEPCEDDTRRKNDPAWRF